MRDEMRAVPRRDTWLRLFAVVGVFVVLASASVAPPSPVAAASVAPPSPLADAAMKRDLATVRALLKEGADVNAPQGDGMTALHWAAEHADTAIATALLRAGASVTPVTRIGAYTPLHIASKRGAGTIVRALLEAGSDAKAITGTGASALHFAAASGSVEAVGALLDHGADPNVQEEEWEQTPLIFAASANRADVIKLLVRRGADPSQTSKAVVLSEQSAMDQAAARRRNEALAELRGEVRDTTAQADSAPPAQGRGGGQGRGAGGQGRTPTTPAQMQAAIDSGRAVYRAADAVTAPFQEEVDTAAGGVAGFTGSVGSMGGLSPLHHAARQGNLEAVIALLDAGADINQLSKGDQTTPLLMSTINGQFDVSMLLIERGADPNLKSLAGATPLWTTVNSQWSPRSRYPQPQAVQVQRATYLEVMEGLLKAGADVNVRLQSTLFYFAYNNCGNSNCGLENVVGSTAFWRAAYSVDVDAMRLLVKYGADPKIPSERLAAAGGGRGGAAAAGGGRGGRGGGAAGGGRGGRGGRGAFGGGDAGAAAAGSDTTGAAVAGGRGQGGARLGRGAADLDSNAVAALIAGRGGRAGGFGGEGRGGGPLSPEDSAARNAPVGVGVPPIVAAAGVGYGNGFAGNSHRPRPDGWMPAMRYLVEELGLDVNERDANGYTPLHHAAARGDNEMILYLVSKGADPKAVARNGRTTVDMANGPVQRLKPFPETIALLESMGAKNNHRCVGC